MIAATDRFRESVDAALISVEALHAAIDDLPSEKVIHINFETSGMPEAAAAAAGAGAGVPGAGGVAADAAAAREDAAAADDDALAHARLSQAVIDAANAALRNAESSTAEAEAIREAGAAADNTATAFARVSAADRDYSASMIDEIGVVAATTGAEERLFAVNAEGVASTVALTEATREHTAAAAEEAIVLESLRGAQNSYDSGLDASIAGQLAAAKTTRLLDEAFAEMDKNVPFAADGLTAAGNAARDSGNAVRGAYGWWGLLNKNVSLFGGLLGGGALGSIHLWHIALDGLFESAVALGEGLAALTVGLAAMAPASEDIYNHLKAVQSVNSALGSSIPPLTGQFRALAQAMAPQTVEAYGGALNLVNQNGTTLAQVAHEVVTGLDDWIAKLDIWHHAQAGMGGMLQNGVGFLHQFEQVVNNVGMAIDNLIKADPGTAHYLMDLVVGFSKVLDVVTSIPAPILMAGLALHSLWLWGGLLTTGLTKLLIPIRALALGVGGIEAASSAVGKLGDGASGLDRLKASLKDIGTGFANAGTGASALASRFAALASSPWTWAVVAAAAIGYLVWQTNQASAAAKALTENLDKGVANAAPSQAIMLVATSVGTLNAKMAQTEHAATQSAAAMGKNWRVASAVNATMKQASNDTNMYRNEIVKLTGEQKNLFNETGHLIGQGFSYSQSLALMDLAGVKTGDSLALMRQKVDNLITGYQNLGVQGGMLANAVSAVTFSAELQNSKIQQLTQSYTTFLGVVTGGESAFVTAEQGVSGLATAARGAGTSIGGLSKNSLQLTSTWQQAITSGGNLVNSLLTQSAAAGMGAKGYNLVSGAAKDYMQQLLPMAKGNQLATAELYALAQTAGYQGVDSFQALSKWIGHTSNAGADLQNKVTALTVASAGLTNDMNALANAISGNLNQAMAAAIAQAHGGQAAFNNFANAAVHAHGTTDGMSRSASALARELIATTGDTNSAHRMFDTFSISLGLSKRQADALWASATHAASGLNSAASAANRTTGAMYASARSMSEAQFAAEGVAAAVRNIPSSKYISITEGVSTYQISAGGLASPHAAGYRVPGYGGGDIHPAMLEGGESVVPKELTPEVAPFLKAHGVPGFEDGGIMGRLGGYGSYGHGGGGYSGPARVTIELNGRRLAEAIMPDLVGAVNRTSRRNNGVNTGKLIPGR